MESAIAHIGGAVVRRQRPKAPGAQAASRRRWAIPSISAKNIPRPRRRNDTEEAIIPTVHHNGKPEPGDRAILAGLAGLAGAGSGWLALAVLPICFVAASLALRLAGGPSWLWFNLDPDYFYLFDALNLVNFETPGSVTHPGTTVQSLGALVLKAAYPFDGADAITAAVLADPESHLRLIGVVMIVLNGCALLVAGVVARRVFGNLLCGLVIQVGPFVSMLVLRHAFHVKPEALLVLAMLMLSVVTMLALEAGRLKRRPMRLAIAFGVVTGFGVATKVTSAPVFLLAPVVLGGWRPIAVWAAASAASVVVFTLPAIGAYGQFFDFLTQVLVSSGDYASGTPSVIDFARYPNNVYKMFSRPVFFQAVFVLSLLSAISWTWRAQRGADVDRLLVRTLFAVCLAQLALALVVAKQPANRYMIPAFMLSPLAAALLIHMITEWIPRNGPWRRRLGWAAAAGFALVASMQVFSVIDAGRELDDQRQTALSLDNRRFEACARIYFYSASSPTFALYLGDFVTGGRFSERLKAGAPANDYWFGKWLDPEPAVLRDWDGAKDMATVIRGYPCVFLRGLYEHQYIGKRLAREVPELQLDASCSTRDESIRTAGVDCQGRLLE